MKVMKKFGAVFLALAMCFSLACVAFAADGSYTITVENSIGGQTYSAYKVFDATSTTGTDENGEPVTYVSYTIKSTDAWYNLVSASDSPFTLTASADGSSYVVSLKDDQTEASVAAWFNAIESYPGAAAATGEGNGGELVLNVTSSGAGYYVIDGGYTSDGATVSLTTAAPDATVIDKNQGPGEGGTIPGDPTWEGGFTKDSQEGTSANIGETIDYVIRSYAPTYDGDKLITEYTFTDTMSAGLTLIDTEGEPDADGVAKVTDGVKVQIISSSGTANSWVDITEYCTITVQHEYDVDGNLIDTILVVDYTIEAITGAGIVYPADAVVEISYQDVVNEAADETDLTNSVTMNWYKVDPDDPTGEPEEGGKTTDETLYTYGFVLSKVDSEENLLSGATFTLKDSNNATITFDATSGGYEVYESSSASTSATTDIEAGSVYIWGLNAGTYTLTEIKAPDGYNLLTDPVVIVITEAYAIDPVTEEPTDEQIGWTVSVDGTVVGTALFDEDGEYGLTSAGIPTVTIENNAGTELPSTGGMGTTIFYIIGGVLVAGAAVVLITRRRMSSES